MNIGEHLRSIRESKKLSQGDIEKKTGLLRSYLSRVENGHTVPSVETLEKIARALDMKIYQILYDGNEPPAIPPPKRSVDGWGSDGKHGRYMQRITRILPQLQENERTLLLYTLAKMIATSKAGGKAA